MERTAQVLGADDYAVVTSRSIDVASYIHNIVPAGERQVLHCSILPIPRAERAEYLASLLKGGITAYRPRLILQSVR